jgi:hypothetical protein
MVIAFLSGNASRLDGTDCRDGTTLEIATGERLKARKQNTYRK